MKHRLKMEVRLKRSTGAGSPSFRAGSPSFRAKLIVSYSAADELREK